MNEEEKEIELNEAWAVIGLPENTVDAEVHCNVYMDGKIVHVRKPLDMKDVKLAFKKAEDGYIDDDDVFVLTEKGKAFVEEMMPG